MWTPKEDNAFDGSEKESVFSISLFFWGTCLIFPDSVLRTIESEVPASQSIRIKSLDEVRRHSTRGANGRHPHVSMMFFNDTVAGDILTHFGSLREEVEIQTWVLAYRDPAIAQRLLNERQTDRDLAGILLLPMDVPISCWTPMLQLVLAGNFFVPGNLVCATQTAPTPRSMAKGDATHPTTLTRREEEVLALVANGSRNKAIAHALSLSEHTVKLHLHHAISKIGARNRTEAANWYLTRQHAERP